MDSRFFEKSPTINMKKDDMIAFISTRGTEIPNPIPIKPVIFEKTGKTNFNSMAEKDGY